MARVRGNPKNFGCIPAASVLGADRIPVPVYVRKRPWRPREHYGCNYWEMLSPKLGRRVKLYRDIEYDHWALVEADPEIVWFCERPMRIHLCVDGYDVESMFHMVVRDRNGHVEYRKLVYASDLTGVPGQRSRHVREAERAWCESHGSGYAIITEQEVRRNPIYVANWKTILHYLAKARTEESVLLENRILRIIADAGGVCALHKIEQLLVPDEPTAVRTAVFRLLYERRLAAPLAAVQLNQTTPMEVPHARSNSN